VFFIFSDDPGHVRFATASISIGRSALRLCAGSAHLEYQLALQVPRFTHAVCFAGVGELVAHDCRWSHRTDVEEGKHPFKMGAVT
jgi:hypothetical protein